MERIMRRSQGIKGRDTKKKLKKKSKEPSVENATVDGAHVSLFSPIKNVCITFNKKFAFTCVRRVIFFFTFHQNKAALL